MEGNKGGTEDCRRGGGRGRK